MVRDTTGASILRAVWSVVGLQAASVLFCLLLALGYEPRWVLALGALAASLFSCLRMVAVVTQARKADKALSRLNDDKRRLMGEVDRHVRAIDQFASGLDVLIFILDAKMNITFANRQARAAFGQPLEGKTIMSGTLSRELEAFVAEAMTSGQPQRAEINLHLTPPRICMAQAWGEPPEYERFFLALYDQTAIKRLERIRRDFVANVSHELRTPMTTIRAMAETLLEEEGSDPALRERFLGIMIREIDRLAGVTKDLLTLSMVESQALKKTPTDFAHLVREALPLVEAKARSKGLELRQDLPQDLPLMGVPSLLSQAAVNLIENAVNYTSKGWVSVTLKEEEGMAVLLVQDTGIGIASEHLPRIFERFYRVDKGRSREKGGTGLGLSIVRNIAESHGGSVQAGSSLNEGSLFRLEIPTETAAPTLESLPEPEDSLPGSKG
jgi:two-component system, OmpR family, phosphate regulon sensor histidine kinase PhoR